MSTEASSRRLSPDPTGSLYQLTKELLSAMICPTVLLERNSHRAGKLRRERNTTIQSAGAVSLQTLRNAGPAPVFAAPLRRPLLSVAPLCRAGEYQADPDSGGGRRHPGLRADRGDHLRQYRSVGR